MKRFISVILVAVLLMCVPMAAFAAPNTQRVDTSIDYMHEMMRAAKDGSPYALHAGAIFERLRNYKIDIMGWGNKYDKTNFFTNGCTQASVLQAIEEFRNRHESRGLSKQHWRREVFFPLGFLVKAATQQEQFTKATMIMCLELPSTFFMYKVGEVIGPTNRLE